MMRAVRRIVEWVAVTVLVGCAPSPPPPPRGPPTYLSDIAPLIAAHCQECHKVGGVSPAPSLADYEDVKSYAEPIGMDVQLRTMPPWGVDDGGWCGTWDDARWLTDDEIARVVMWQQNGAPEGLPDTISAATPPLPTQFTPGALLDIGGVYQPGLGPGGNRCFVADPALDRDRLLTAIRVSSSDPRAVAQVTLFSLDSDAAEAAAASLDAGDPGLGYSCFGTTRTPDARLVASWSWPTPVLNLPAGTGVRLHAGRELVVQIHYDSHASPAGSKRAAMMASGSGALAMPHTTPSAPDVTTRSAPACSVPLTARLMAVEAAQMTAPASGQRNQTKTRARSPEMSQTEMPATTPSTAAWSKRGRSPP